MAWSFTRVGGLLHRIIAAAVVAAALAVPSASAGAGGSDQVRVMMLGDSVTHGLSGEYTWRYFSWKGLEQTGAVVDFVGPHVGTYSDDGWFDGTYADSSFDQDHASRYGLSLWETLFFPGGERTPSVEELMAHEPDVIVETLGVNDLMTLNQTSEQLSSHVVDLVGRARAVDPTVDVVLGALPQVWIERVPAYNAMLPQIAAELSTPGSRVVVTPVADFTRGVETYDDAHPTLLGMRKIAASVSAGLEQLGIGRTVLMPEPGSEESPSPSPSPSPWVEPPPPTSPSPSVEPSPWAEPSPSVEPSPSAATSPPSAAPVAGAVPLALVKPTAPRRVRAAVEGRRTTVTWRRVATAERYAVTCGRVRTRVEGRQAVLRVRADRCAVRAANAAGVSEWVRVAVRLRPPA